MYRWKTLLVVMLLWSGAQAKDMLDLRNKGVTLNYVDDYDKKHSIVIARSQEKACSSFQASPATIWGKAQQKVPAACKGTFVTTVGKITPIKAAEGIETYGELEVISFMKKAAQDPALLLVDARMPAWYEYGTIPSAINLPFKYFDEKAYPDDFEDVLARIGVKAKKEGGYDFTEAKTLLLFCNGTWCPQSSFAIKNLLRLGYPAEKMKWYRGGLSAWKMLDLTTVVP